MREAYGGLYLYIIVVVFMVLFSCFLAFSVNYSRVFKVKDEIVDIIEKNNGLYTANGAPKETVSQIKKYLLEVGYRSTGKCDEGFSGFDLTNPDSKNVVTRSNPRDNKNVFCLQRTNAATGVRSNKSIAADEQPLSVYYTVQVFFKLDIPVIDRAFRYNVYGSTKKLFYCS